jgi:hypothetical protein
MGYKYAAGFHSGHLEFTYKGWYPVVELNLDVNSRKATQTALYEQNNKFYAGETPRSNPYVDASARVYIPLNLSSDGRQRGFIPQADVHFTNDLFHTPASLLSYAGFTDYYFRYLLTGITWYDRLSMALRELYPRWGYMLKLLHLNPLSESLDFGHITAVQLTTYSPGLLPNHSLQLKAGYQYQDTQGKIYYLPRLLSPPRGYPYTSLGKETAFSADYSFPLFYPHWNIGWAAYFKRVQVNLFSDYAALTNHQGNRRNVSAGFDLSVDGHLFRFAFPVSAGVRCAFPLAGGLPPTINLLFDVRFE